MLRETFAAGRTGSRAFAGLLAAAALAFGIGTNIGLTGPVALAVGLLLFILVGTALEVHGRRQLREQAFARRDPHIYLDPIADFRIHPWLGGDSESELPDFVERRMMKRVLEGLWKKRFVILIGPDESGKSRLAYEAAARSSEIVLVARPAPPHIDPLIELMNDRRGFTAMEEDQILLLTDLAGRLSAGSISGESIRYWLDDNPKISIIATLNSKELARIDSAGGGVVELMRELRREAEVVRVKGRLVDEELEEARRKFPQIDPEVLPLLTRYLAWGTPLREVLDEAREEHSLGHAIVCAVADWRRAGIRRPAPVEVVRKIAEELAEEDDVDFAAALRWALEPRGPAALIYEVDGEDGVGYAPDNIVVGLFDDPETRRPISDFAWRAIEAAVEEKAVDGSMSDSDVATALLSFGEAALKHGNEAIARQALEAVARLGSMEQQRQAVDLVLAHRDSPLIDSRRGDGLIHRLKPVKMLAEGRRFMAGKPLLGSTGHDRRILAAIYRRHSLRSFMRVLVLAFADILSTGVGLFAGLGIRGLISDAPIPIPPESVTSDSFVALWATVTVFIFASTRLYRKEIPRALISGIATAVAIFTVFGLVMTLVEGFDVSVALISSLGGGVVAFGLDFILRFAYDEISRQWVKNHGLEARTLLIGSARQAVAVERALAGMSRPTRVIGYLLTDSLLRIRSGPRCATLGQRS